MSYFFRAVLRKFGRSCSCVSVEKKTIQCQTIAVDFTVTSWQLDDSNHCKTLYGFFKEAVKWNTVHEDFTVPVVIVNVPTAIILNDKVTVFSFPVYLLYNKHGKYKVHLGLLW